MACHQWSEGNYAENNKPKKKKKENKNSEAMLTSETINVSTGKTLFCMTKIPTFEKSLCHLKWLFALVNPFVFAHLKLFQRLKTLCLQCYLIFCIPISIPTSNQTEWTNILSSLDFIYFSFENSFGFSIFQSHAITYTIYAMCMKQSYCLSLSCWYTINKHMRFLAENETF